MTVRGAAPPPSQTINQRPTDRFAGAIYDAKHASNPASRTMAAAALNQLVKEAALEGGGRGDQVALSVFRHLQGADQQVISQFRDLVIGDSSYSLQQWQAGQLESFANAAMGQGAWPPGTNT